MWSVRVCVGCLATDVRMYSMNASGLLQPYQLLAGIKNVVDIPQKLCWECAALVNKFDMFKRKCERAHLLLRDIYTQHQEITEEQARSVDRSEHNLVSPYSITELTPIDSTLATLSEEPKKGHKEPLENVPVKVECDVKQEEVKSEDEMPYTDIKEDCDVVEPKTDEDLSELEQTIEQLKQNTAKQKNSACKTKDLAFEKEFKVTEYILTLEQAREVYSKKISRSKYDSYPYKCPQCLQAFKELKLYKKHQNTHNPKRGPHECYVCRKRFKTKGAQSLHQDRHLNKFICKICSKVTYTRGTAKNHYRIHKKNKSVKTPKKTGGKPKGRRRWEEIDADEIVLTQEQQMEAVRERRNAEGYEAAKYKCDLCYKTFNELKTYSTHMMQHDPGSGELECDICRLRYNTRKKIYKHISNNHLRKFVCKLCPHVCYNRSFAKNHNRWHRGVVYKCKQCGATFDKMTSYRNHIRIKHPSEHVCSECGEAFVSRLGVWQHANKMHSLKRDGGSNETASGPYCSACDVKFTRQQAWTRHILISPKHAHEKSTIVNGCQYCGETFTLAADFKRHYITEHKKHRRALHASLQQFPSSCALCDESMTSASKYWQHFRQQHPGKPFPLTRTSFICEYCGNWFKNKPALQAHKHTHNEFISKEKIQQKTNPYVCEWCGKSFAYDGNLKKHELSVHCASLTPSSSQV